MKLWYEMMCTCHIVVRSRVDGETNSGCNFGMIDTCILPRVSNVSNGDIVNCYGKHDEPTMLQKGKKHRPKHIELWDVLLDNTTCQC